MKPPEAGSGAETPAFSAALKAETAAVHREAERSGFIADLIRGQATRSGYVLFLRNLQPVYAALERCLAHRRQDGPKVVAVFAQPALRRLGNLENDLSALGGQQWRSLSLLPETRAYALAIEEASGSEEGMRLAAHAYARYLGDLSGGQILKPVLARLLGLPPSALTFYDFPDLPDLATAKDDLRGAIDTIPTGSRAARVFTEEAIDAFRHTIAMSLAVQRHQRPEA